MARIQWAAVALFTFCAEVAAAQSKFTSAPAADDLLAAYPPRALADQVEGRVVIEFEVAEQGALADCRASSETPAASGFGAAAVSLAPKIRMASGFKVGDTIAIPVHFVPSPPRREPVFTPNHGRFRDLGGAGPYYPERAERMNVQGAALMQCRLAATGHLTECEVVDEKPAGFNFREAALKMAEKGWLTAQPRTVDGVVRDGERVELLVPFTIDRPRRGGS